MHETIKKLREQNNYSQTAVAGYLKISRQMYVKYETGDVEPPIKIVRQLSNLYKVDYDVIIDDKFADKFIDDKFSVNQGENMNFHNSYKTSYEGEKNFFVASSAPAYSVSHKNKSISYFETVADQIRNLKEFQLPVVEAFIHYLTELSNGASQESSIKVVEKCDVDNVAKNKKSKDAFFALAGKINLDNDELTEFREKSLI